jgi:hypothetical protein
MEQLKIKNDTTKLQQLLGSKLYSDKYSFISEALQNSTDAMRKIGKQEENFDVGIKQVDSDFYFYIRDYGCSFDSIEEFKRLVGTLLESSKTQSKDSTENQELGKYGIGSISFSAYQKSCNYIVYKNGKGFKARLEEVENKGLFIKCEDYFESDEPQGVYFELIIDKYDLTTFYDKLIEKSKYFQNIRFKFDLSFINSQKYIKEELLEINDKFAIYKSDDFQFSTLNQDKYLHICLDQYSYPIKWEELGIDKISMPIALRFNLNDFETNPTREVITIEKDYKDKVLAKIQKVADWFYNKYNEENPVRECSDMFNFRDSINNLRDTIKIGENTFYLNNLKAHTNIILNRPVYKEYSYTDINNFTAFMSQTWNLHYTLKYSLKNDVLRRNDFARYSENNNIFIGKSLKRVEQEYYKSLKEFFKFYNKSEVVYHKLYEEIIDEAGDITYKSRTCFLNYVGKSMDKYLEDEGLKAYVDIEYDKFMKLKEEFETLCFKNVEIPKEFLDKAKVVKESKPKVVKNNDQIILKYPRRPQKWISWNAIWEDNVVNILDLRKLPKLHIYGLESQRRKLEFIFTNLKNIINNLELIMVSEKTKKMIEQENPHNFIYIEDLKSRLDLMSKYVTANYIRINLEKHKEVVTHTNIKIIREHISTKIGDDLLYLMEFLQKYNNEKLFEYPSKDQVHFLEEIFNLFKDNPKLYHQEYIDLFNRLDKNLEKLDFLPLFTQQLYYLDRQDMKLDYTRAQIALKTMRDLCKYKQLRMDWGYYVLDKVQEVITPVEEELKIDILEETENFA